jgi:hypothetical protein
MVAPNNQKTVRRIGLCLLMAMAMAAAYEVTAGYGNVSSMVKFFFVSICLIVSGMEVEGIPQVSLVSAIIEG